MSGMGRPGPNPNRGPARPGDARRVRAEDLKEEKTLPIGAWLLVLTGKHKGEDFRIREGKNIVGSDPTAAVCLTDDHISQQHAHISCKRQSETGGAYSVFDLDSTNGTFLNDSKEKLTKEELVDNDTITFGTTRCKFKCV